MKVCVYGAASPKIDPKFKEPIKELGREIARRGHTLVFGAGKNGSMGAVAEGVKECGGKIIGVVPKFFIEEGIEAMYEGCDELITPDTMHERKNIMETTADAFIITPGGVGTFEELFETLTLKQLGRHEKPIAIFNIDGFYDILERMMYEGMKEKFIRSSCDLLYLTCTDMDEIFDYIEYSDGMAGLTFRQLKDG